MQSEEELTQTRVFERIFPRADTSEYLDMMDTRNYYDLLLAAWEHEYADNREEGRERLREAAQSKIHLNVPETERRMKIAHKSPVLYKRNLKVPHIFEKK